MQNYSPLPPNAIPKAIQDQYNNNTQMLDIMTTR